MEGEETSIEFTPTWAVAAVCTVMVGVSLALERLLHYAGKVGVILTFLFHICYHT